MIPFDLRIFFKWVETTLVFCCGHQVSKWHSDSTRLIGKDPWITLGVSTLRGQRGFHWCLKGGLLFTSLLWQPPWCAHFGYLFQSIWMTPLSSCSGQDCGWLLDMTRWNEILDTTPYRPTGSIMRSSLLGFELFFFQKTWLWSSFNGSCKNWRTTPLGWVILLLSEIMTELALLRFFNF